MTARDFGAFGGRALKEFGGERCGPASDPRVCAFQDASCCGSGVCCRCVGAVLFGVPDNRICGDRCFCFGCCCCCCWRMALVEFSCANCAHRRQAERMLGPAEDLR